MDRLKELLQRLRAHWNRWTPQRRISTAAGAALCLALVAAVGYWSSRPRMVPLVSTEDTDKIAAVIERLESEKISYEQSSRGFTVLVPEQLYGKARVACRAEFDQGDLWDESPGIMPPPPGEQRERQRRLQEEEIRKTIETIAGVTSARVHLALNPREGFIRQGPKASATVVVGLAEPESRGRALGKSIAQLVANAVNNLTAEMVQVVDTTGRALWGGTVSGLEELDLLDQFTRIKEASIAAKVTEQLEKLVGPGKVDVQVTAEINFKRTTTETTTVDPDAAKLREKISTSEPKPLPAAQGAAGTASNLAVRPSGSGTSFGEKRSDSEIDYEPGRTLESQVDIGGDIRRQSVAVVIDLSEKAGKLTEQQIEDTVRRAVGIDEERGDTISVVNTELVMPADLLGPLPVAADWTPYIELARNLSLSVSALLAFVLGLLTLRRLKPMVLPQAEGLTSEASRVLAEVAEQTRRRPELLQRVVETWLAVPPQATLAAAGAAPVAPPVAGARAARAA